MMRSFYYEKISFPRICSFSITKLFAQINLQDSSVQVISYWDNKEKQTYHISHEKYKVKGKDTVDRELGKYDVDITIKDSTANSYLVEWKYKNFKLKSDNKFTNKLGFAYGEYPDRHQDK